MHKLQSKKQKKKVLLPGEKSNHCILNVFNSIYLIINAAATFRTFGHFSNAITVNKFPQIPTIIMSIVAAAAKFSNGRPNLELKSKKKNISKS